MFIWYSEYTHGDTVYVKVDEDQQKQTITQVIFNGDNDKPRYLINSKSHGGWYYEYELSPTKIFVETTDS